MSTPLLDRIAADLNKRRMSGLDRALSLNGLIDFSSNDYLGLARSEALHHMILKRAAELHSPYNGATGSRLISGNSALAEEVEDQLAILFRGESALLFNSGYSANLGVLSSLPGRNDVILYDELCHASIKDGARLSLAKKISFRHNDLDDLESKLRRTDGHCFIVAESIYSMDGDRSPVKEFAKLANQYEATMVLDEAHSTGIVGEHGEGTAVALGVEKEVAIRVYTFGKAMGSHGACVVVPRVIKQYLINASRPFIYTTAMSPHALLTISCAFQYLSQHPELQQQLQANVALFAGAMQNNNTFEAAPSAIQRLIIPGNEQVINAASVLRGKGFDVRAIRRPTVPDGTERLRICLHAFNSPAQIAALAEALNNLDMI